MHLWAPPSQILTRVDEITGPLAFDHETSGLYAADGARVSATSVAWFDDDGAWQDWGRAGLVHWAVEPIAEGIERPVVSAAWPFDQGTAGKPEDTGQDSLFGTTWENLPSREWRALCEILEQGGDYLTNQNIKFDLEKNRYGVRRWPGVGCNVRDRVGWDTQLATKIVWPTLTDGYGGRFITSLKPVSALLWGQAEVDDAKIVKEYLRKNKLPAGRWDLMPWDVIGAYADQDSRLAVRLTARQQYELDRGIPWLVAHDGVNKGFQLVEREIAVLKVLDAEEERGVPYPKAESGRIADQVREVAQDLAAGLPFEPDINDAKAYFFSAGPTKRGQEGLDLLPYLRTEQDAVSLTSQVLDQMVLDQVPHAERYRDFKKLTTAHDMWYAGYARMTEDDGRLRTHFRQGGKADGGEGGTRSNRFSVERVNLQAIPHDYRLTEYQILAGIQTPRQLIGRAVQGMEGWGLWELDLAQAELRVAAMLADCRRHLELISSGADLHGDTADNLFGDKGDYTRRRGEYRQVGKRGNFSLIFGIGWVKLQADILKQTGIRLTDNEAQLLHRDWNNLTPEYKRAIDKHADRVEVRQRRYGFGWIDLISGQRRWFERYEDSHKAFNQRVQPNLAEFGKDWMLKTEEYLRHWGIDRMAAKENIGGAGLILTIHDSQVLLLPEDVGDQLAADCADFARDLWSRYFPGVPGDVDTKRWDVEK